MLQLVEPPYQAGGGERNPSVDSGVAIDWTALSPTPVRLSASVAAQIEEMVTSGQLQSGRRLPSERLRPTVPQSRAARSCSNSKTRG